MERDDGTVVHNWSFLTTYVVYQNLDPDTYVVYLKDSNNCQRTYNITITEPQTVTFTETHTDPT